MDAGHEHLHVPTRANADTYNGQRRPAPLRKRKLWMRASMLLLSSQLRAIIRKGTLTVIAPDGRGHEFGCDSPSVTIRITNWTTVHRLSLDPDLAIGESYMDGTLIVENTEVYAFVDLCLSNLGVRADHRLRGGRALTRRIGRRFTQHNPVSMARANAAHHYDLSDTLYALFLDADR